MAGEPPWPGLLLDLWRQVAQHLEIGLGLEEFAHRLAADLPVQRIWIRTLDPGLRWIETTAVAPWGAELGAVPGRQPLTEAEGARLLAWLPTDQWSEATGSLRDWLAPGVGRDGVALVGRLVDGERTHALVLEGPRRLRAGLPALSDLREPLTVALRNDRRLHELARLREAVEADNRALLTRLGRDRLAGQVVGADAGLREVMERVQRVGPTDTPVLILGETGTGKELIAREIHQRSPRRAGPFLKVNCGAIPAELVDSELFGHERGSFTGAVANRRGWFERADGGTLFLDEIGELPPAAQVRLLRVLQDGTFERVGGQRPLHAEVRLVAATHRDLPAMVRQGKFREDLWYRVGVFPLRLPPLRERPQDLRALAAHFAARAGERLLGRPLHPTEEDLTLLRAYPWPGNVRELGAVLERAAILGDGQGLDVRSALGLLGDASPPPLSESGASTLEEIQREAIQRALRAARGRIEGPRGAAARLGLAPSTLRSRLSVLGLSADTFREKGESE